MNKAKLAKGITLISLVITIIIIIILAMVTITFLLGENGIVTQAGKVKEMSNIETVREKLEMAEGTAVVDGKGDIEPDHYFDIIEEEGIIGNKETDVIDNEDGTYDVITEDGYIFQVTLLPSPEEVEDLEIEYNGTSEGPRVTNVTTEWRLVALV